MTYLVILVCGSAIGFTMGALGGGGGVMIVPVLIYVLGYPTHLSSAVAKLIVGSSSLAGVIMRLREGSVVVSSVLIVAAASLPSAAIGGWLSAELPGKAMRLLLAAVVVGGAAAMLLSPTRRIPPLPIDADRPDAGGSPTDGDPPPRRAHWGWVLLAGAVVGFLGGALGVGGGFLLVPALHFSGLTMRQSIGTSLANISLNCAIGLATGWSNELPWGDVALFMAVAWTAAIAGARMARRLAGPQLRKGFASFLLVLGGLILVEVLFLR